MKSFLKGAWLPIDTSNILITSAGKQLSLAKEIIKELKGTNAERKVYTCDMNPESVSGIIESDGCFKVPICMSEDFVETIWSLCIEYNIGHIITMTEKEFIILSANKDMFGKYGVQVVDYRVISNPMKIIQELQLNNRM